MSREIALVGGGHAHIEVIRRWGLNPVAGTRLSVFDPNPRPVYSGMVPGFIAGQYDRHELEIDLKALCDRARAEYHERAASIVGPSSIQLEDGSTFPFDAASLDIGSTVEGLGRAGVRRWALPARPISRLIEGVEKIAEDASHSAPIHVVGGGAGGVEVAFCLEARTRRGQLAGRRVVLISSDSFVLGRASHSTRVERALHRRGIELLRDSVVTSIQDGSIDLLTGERLPSAGVVWVTGAAAHRMPRESGLPLDDAGFIKVHPTLRVQGYENLFAVGDCASLPGMKKAGVYAVRAGPLLDHNLRATLTGGTLRDYSPQDDFLSILNLGDGTAIGKKWNLAFEGRAMMWLKDRIDRSFMEKYQ